MGNYVGYMPHNGINHYLNPELNPSPFEEPTFDPNIGFENGRKERVMIATEDEMISAKLKLNDRDYCAHLLLKYRACRKDNWPFAVKCSHEKHEYLHCEHEDFVLRMKEFEREKRLRLRAQNNPELKEARAA